MSHMPERKEKVCLNCGTQLNDRFCPRCGQENLEPKESFWHLVVHFVNDFTHFDGKFFGTIKLLLTRPGFLPEEYIRGRRAKYLNPIRMFLFISFIFFVIAHWIPDSSKPEVNVVHSDTVVVSGVLKPTDTTLAAYNQRQLEALPEDLDGPIRQFLVRQYLSQANNDPKKFDDEVGKFVINSAPKIVFISVPFFALMLYLLHLRRRHKYYFVAHGIFAVHYYCAFFLMMLIVLVLNRMAALYNPYFSTATLLVYLWMLVYLYYAMRYFYEQHWFKTLIKLVIIVAGSFVLFITLSILAMLTGAIVVGH